MRILLSFNIWMLRFNAFAILYSRNNHISMKKKNPQALYLMYIRYVKCVSSKIFKIFFH